MTSGCAVRLCVDLEAKRDGWHKSDCLLFIKALSEQLIHDLDTRFASTVKVRCMSLLDPSTWLGSIFMLPEHNRHAALLADLFTTGVQPVFSPPPRAPADALPEA
jgi:hypothetical protein